MLPFLTQPAVAPACYVPKAGISAQSLLFRADPTYLQRVPATAGNRKLVCLDACVTPVNQGVNRPILVAGDSTADYVYIDVGADNVLRVQIMVGGSMKAKVWAVPVLRDIATYHLRIVLDVENASAADRVRLYQDGTRLAVAGPLDLATTDLPVLCNTVTHRIGRTTLSGYTDQFAGLMADMVLVDGAVPSPFGERNIHGVWVRKPKAEIQAAVAAAGGFGPHGFHLDFSDPVNPGKDVSGKGNHWSVSGFDATGKDTVASTPTNVYATLNALVLPRYNNERYQLGDGNCRATSTSGGYPAAVPTMMVRTGRWYDETTVEALSGPSDGLWIGLYGEADITAGYPSAVGNTATSVAYMPGGSKKSADNPTAFGAAWGAGAIIGRAIDCETGGVWFSKNGVWQGGGDPATGVNPAFTFTPGHLVTAGWTDPSNAGGATFSVNFGQRPFAYAPPAGFKTLCTDNLPEPDIKAPAEATVGASAAAGSLVAVLDAMTTEWGDWLEIGKQRDGSQDWALRTTRRPGRVVNWPGDSDGDNAFAGYAAGTWLGRRWRLGARWGCQVAVVAKTAVGAETFAWPEGWGGRSVGMMWARRIDAGPASLLGYHRSLGASDYMVLSASGVTTAGTAAWGGMAPTDSQFTLGTAFPAGALVLVVGWAEIAGHSWFGQYSANGAADGPFIPGGVAPDLFAVLSNRDATQDRAWIDAAAGNGVNPCDKSLFLDLATAESGGQTCDFVVGGAKARAALNNINNSTNRYLAAMWGRPVGGVCVAPATAR